MRRTFLILAVFAMAGIAVTVLAATEDEKRLEREASVLNQDARQWGGEHVIAQILRNELNADQVIINNLRKQKLGYGDIAIILSLAQQMPGRTAEVNVTKIMSLRLGAPEERWEAISDKLGLKLGAVVIQVSGIQREAHEDIKKAQYRESEKEGPYERASARWMRWSY